MARLNPQLLSRAPPHQRAFVVDKYYNITEYKPSTDLNPAAGGVMSVSKFRAGAIGSFRRRAVLSALAVTVGVPARGSGPTPGPDASGSGLRLGAGWIGGSPLARGSRLRPHGGCRISKLVPGRAAPRTVNGACRRIFRGMPGASRTHRACRRPASPERRALRHRRLRPRPREERAFRRRRASRGRRAC